MVEETLVLLKNARTPGYQGSFSEYEKTGGFIPFLKILKDMQPEEVVNLVKESGLRGRGGAGFPTGLKWSFMAKNTGKPSYLVCNADEGEPGTCKDREIILNDPFLFLEGMMIGCYAVGCNRGYIYVRGEFTEPIQILERSIEILKQNKLLGKNIQNSNFDLDLVVHPGAGAYICGEETALLDSLEGKRGEPRVKPPFPAVAGFDACPTSVNNVETLANLPVIIREGVEAFQANGSPNCAGTRLVCVSGNVKKPGVYEVKMGVNLKGIIEDLAGGMQDGKKLKGVIPGGSSSPVLLPEEIDIPYDYDSIAKAGSMMGSCGMIIIDQDINIVQLLYRLISFYNHESCGQCTPCREGMNWIRIMLRDLISGKGDKSLIENINRAAKNIMGNTLCALGDAGAMPTRAFIQKFPQEFEFYIKHKQEVA